MCLCFEKVLNFYFNKLVLGVNRRGREGGKQHSNEADCHIVMDFNIGCKITNTYNKQNIYSVLKFTVQCGFECSFFGKCGWGFKFVHFKTELVDTDY